MKRIIALVLAAMMVLALVACGAESTNGTKTAGTTEPATEATKGTQGTETATTVDDVKVMSYAEYAAAEVNDEVVIEGYVQAKQSWWDNKATVYLQDKDGAYFLYDMACSEEDYAKLTDGTKIRVAGYKSEWSGEVEITDATFEILEGADTYIAEAVDVTELLGTDELIEKQNQKVLFKGLTVVAYDDEGNAFNYKNAEDKTDDLYFKASINDGTYGFCVEFYLCGQDTEVYKAVEGLKVGDVINIEGFLYWYNGSNPHVTSVTVVD